MRLREWNELPEFMKNKEVKKYYNHLKKKKASLLLKRLFDVVMSTLMIIAYCLF